MVKVTALTKEEAENCPIRQILVKITGKWSLLIFLTLEDQAMRFGALKRAIGDVTQRVLTENLRTLERDGFLTRTVSPGPPVAVSYDLTPMGRDVLTHLRSLTVWAATHSEDVALCRSSYDARTAS